MAGLDRVITLVKYRLSAPNVHGERTRTEFEREDVWAERTDRGQTTEIGLIETLTPIKRSYRVRWTFFLAALVEVATLERVLEFDVIDTNRTLLVRGVYEDTDAPRRRFIIIDVEDP